MKTQNERVMDGQGTMPVIIWTEPKIKPGCETGRHCAAHGAGPFYCCKCGASFVLAGDPTVRR
jgi:hypothetical protein